MFLHQFPFSQALLYVKFVDNYLSSLSEKDLDRWATSQPAQVVFVLQEFTHGILTHPGFNSASAAEQQSAYDGFRGIWETVGDYAPVVETTNILLDVALNGHVDAVDAIVENIPEATIVNINGFDWAQVIGFVANAPFVPGSTTTVEEANEVLADVMEVLGGLSVDIAQVVDIGQLSGTLVWLAGNANLDGVDAIVSNLNDMAETYINGFDWAQVLGFVANAPFTPGSTVTVDQANAALQSIMEQLADNTLGGIEQIVDIGQLSGTLVWLAGNANLDGVDAIVSNLNDMAETYINGFDWAQVIGSVANAPNIPGSTVTVEEANDALRDIMEQLADNTLGGIEQIVDIGQLNGVLVNMAANTNSEGVDAIIDNLSTTAMTYVDTAALQNFGVTVGSENADLYLDSSSTQHAFFGLGGNDLFLGAQGDTFINGGDGNDTIAELGGGDDVLYGGDGSDALYGGTGADTFVFREGDTGVDTIHDFSVNDGDLLDLTSLLESYDSTQHAIEDFIQLTTVGNDLVVTVDADGQGPGTGASITTIVDGAGLTINDLIDINEYG